MSELEHFVVKLYQNHDKVSFMPFCLQSVRKKTDRGLSAVRHVQDEMEGACLAMKAQS